MKTIPVEIPEGKRAEWVNDVLTLVDEPKKCHEFKVGDKAILNSDVCFVQFSGDYILINVGTEVEILEVFNRADATESMYKVKHQHSTAMVLGRTLDKIEYKFNIGDRVTLVGCPLAVFTITDQIIKDGKLYYGVEGLPNCLPYEESELMPYGNKKVEHKFNVGDKVKTDDGQTYIITRQFVLNGEHFYNLKDSRGEIAGAENWLTLIPQSITERIKTFDDAVEWCIRNNKNDLYDQFLSMINAGLQKFKDISAYFKLRIITTALNEGWEPIIEDGKYKSFVGYNAQSEEFDYSVCRFWVFSPKKLLFKSESLAQYAAVQFRDIYADFFGCKKSDNQ